MKIWFLDNWGFHEAKDFKQSEKYHSSKAVFYGTDLNDILTKLEENGILKFISPDSAAKIMKLYTKEITKSKRDYRDTYHEKTHTHWTETNYQVERTKLTDELLQEMIEFDPKGTKLKKISFTNLRDYEKLSDSTFNRYFNNSGFYSPGRPKMLKKQRDKETLLRKQGTSSKLIKQAQLLPSISILKIFMKEMAKNLISYIRPLTLYINPKTFDHREVIKFMLDIVAKHKKLFGNTAYRDLKSYTYCMEQITPYMTRVNKETEALWVWIAKEHRAFKKRSSTNDKK